MKFCKDCKHFQRFEDTGTKLVEVDWCNSPKRPFDMVNGNQKLMRAEHSRNLAITGCGEDAKWFEGIEDADLDDLSKIPFGK
jgi:hypothetical protein